MKTREPLNARDLLNVRGAILVNLLEKYERKRDEFLEKEKWARAFEYKMAMDNTHREMKRTSEALEDLEALKRL